MQGGSRILEGERLAELGLSGRFAGWFRFTFGSVDRGGNRDLSGIPSRGVESMVAKTPGWRRGSSPEAAKRCGTSRRALRATTVPVILGEAGLGVGHQEFRTPRRGSVR